MQLDIDSILKTYRRYAPRYDLYFGALLQSGRRSLIERMRVRPGDRILEVGVGTGLSLPVYPSFVEVTGIDLSPEMLARARARRARLRLPHVVALRCMDAEAMRFADDSFDKVVAMYVASVVPDPVRLVNEMRRVCTANGELYIVNHFHHANPLVGGLERATASLARLLGFHPDFSLETFVRDAELEVTEQAPVNLFGYWTLLRARNNKITLARNRRSAAGQTDDRLGAVARSGSPQ
jgi:phosphatidylethanolamine/phosphatidyl-N-methylethanolamine N-methyltransferase